MIGPTLNSACALQRLSGPVAYNDCVSSQLASLGNSRAANLSRLSDDDRSNIESACALQRLSGPVAYNDCVSSQLASLGNSRAANLSRLSDDDRSNIESACALQRLSGPVAYNNCVSSQLASLQQSQGQSSATASGQSSGNTWPVAPSAAAPSYPSPSPACAENGSCYGDISAITGLPKTTAVSGYYRANGTYVRGYYRSR